MEAGMARAIFRQWTEARDERRRYTQIAQTWPLEGGAKFENIEAALHTLREGHALVCFRECTLWARQLEARQMELEFCSGVD